MTESQPSAQPIDPQANNNLVTWGIIAIVIAAIIGASYYYLSMDKPQPTPAPPVVIEEVAPEVVEPVVEDVVVEPEPEILPEPVELPAVEEEIVEPEAPKIQLPLIDESDSWIKEKLTQLTWRKELLRLVIDDDMVRRLVVFTDNFAQGLVSYEYSPLTKPQTKFSALESSPESNNNEAAIQQQQWQWNDAQSQRFKLYVDLLRSFEPEQLANWYFELKPLIDEAYGELGYPEQDFTDVLQDALVRVLDMEIPKDDLTLIRPSVMYKYANTELEQLPATDKLLLRIGKDNLLVIKSFLLEFSDALSRAENRTSDN